MAVTHYNTENNLNHLPASFREEPLSNLRSPMATSELARHNTSVATVGRAGVFTKRYEGACLNSFLKTALMLVCGKRSKHITSFQRFCISGSRPEDHGDAHSKVKTKQEVFFNVNTRSNKLNKLFR